MDDLAGLTAVALRALLARGDVTPKEVVQAHLRRIAARDLDVRAWTHLAPIAALDAAAAAEPDAARPLAGIPVAFKDICDTADMPTRYGSRLYADHRPQRDALCVSMTRAAGGIVLGKTVTTEFAGRAPGPTANPHDPGRTPGGSSSGSAAAVADGQVPLAVGSQTAGSTIRPAAYCGIYALKPSFAEIPFTGMKQLCARLDTIGLMARCLDDLALFRACLLGIGPGALDPVQDPLRIGVCRTPYWDQASDYVSERFDGAVATLANAGHEVQEIPYPAAISDPEQLCWAAIHFEMARQFHVEYRQAAAGLAPETADSIEKGFAIPMDEHAGHLRQIREAEAAFDHLLGAQVDVLVAPAAGEEAPEGLHSTGRALFNAPFHLAGLPAVALPLATPSGRLPVGLQVLGRRHDDWRLLGIADALDRSLQQSDTARN